MDVTGRIMDSIAEVPQTRRAKASVAPAIEGGQTAGLSFAETLIGLVQPPSALEAENANPETSGSVNGAASSSEGSQPENAAPKASQEGAIAVTPASVPTPTPLAVVTQANLEVPQSAPQSETGGAVASRVDPSQATATMPTVDPITTLADDLPILDPTLESPTPASTQAPVAKLQPTATQTLLAGLVSLGHTQQPAADDERLAQLVAQANNSLATQGSQATPAPTNPGPPVTGGPTLNLALAADPQGPGATRALEAQTADGRAAKPNQAGFAFSMTAGVASPQDNGLQNLSQATAQPALGQQAPVLAASGVVPNLAKATIKPDEAKVTANDSTGLLNGSSGIGDGAATQSASLDGSSASGPDPTPKPHLVQPHTIPLLAAAMMRRISNGLKEFTLRLDPPELGRVDVRLTVGADKKVRAVVSTDKPEALKDLALSARDLTRALQEAGLDLEENGLSFSMNDQGNSQHNQDANQGQGSHLKHSLDAYETAETAAAEPTAPRTTPISGPVERWQRARIAITV